MVITDLLERNARLYPDEVALVEINPAAAPDRHVTWREYELIEPSRDGRYRRELTWKDFDTKANRFANFLFTRGIKRGDKVGILLMNSLEWLPIYFGILKTGALAVPFNYRYTREEIVYCADLADVKLLVFGPQFIERIDGARPLLAGVEQYIYVGADTPAYASNYAEMVKYCSSTAPAVLLDPADEAAIYFSSGTTGFPKAILHAHESLISAAIVEQAHHKQTREDVFLCIPPLYHTGAKMHWFGSLLAGSKAVLLRGVRPDWILEAVTSERATIVWLLVPWVQDLLDAIDSGAVNLDEYRLAQWRLMHIGAQPVPPSLVKRWLKRFPTHQYDVNYGLSEGIGPGSVHLGMENLHKLGAIGKAGHLWQTRVVDASGEPVTGDAVGELVIKGPGVMRCYYKNPEATAQVLKDGWLYTGDMARLDDEGFIYLVDRKKDVIISGGENLYPVQIEDFLRQHPRIADVAVIGLPDDRLGEIAAAIIKAKDDGLTAADLDDFMTGLPRYKRPKKLIFADVPRNPTGKIEKPKLRERYCGTRLVETQFSR